MFVPAISMAFCTLSFVLWHFGQFLPFLVWEVVIVKINGFAGFSDVYRCSCGQTGQYLLFIFVIFYAQKGKNLRPLYFGYSAMGIRLALLSEVKYSVIYIFL